LRRAQPIILTRGEVHVDRIAREVRRTAVHAQDVEVRCLRKRYIPTGETPDRG
jgi:hypothetical protein